MSASPVPRYVEIERHLRETIAAAAPGDPLPSDADLCARFGVSRMTARQAVQTLATEGLLYRRRGHGTFVAARPLHRRMGTLLSFSEEMVARGFRPSSRVIEAAWAVAARDEAAELGLAPGERVVVVHRVRLADEVPVAIERVALPPACAGVLDADLSRASLHAELARLGRTPSWARGSMVARISTPEDELLLELDAPRALLVERRLVADQAGLPVERTESRYSSERYVFDVELHRVGRGGEDGAGPG